jgi:hypothetical protein
MEQCIHFQCSAHFIYCNNSGSVRFLRGAENEIAPRRNCFASRWKKRFIFYDVFTCAGSDKEDK